METKKTSEGQKCEPNFPLRIIILIVILILVLLTFLAILLAEYSLIVDCVDSKPRRSNEEWHSRLIRNSSLDYDKVIYNSSIIHMIPRFEWLARSPTEPPNRLSTPVPYVIIWHTATDNCSTQAECSYIVRKLQTFHIESRHWWDIGYNFLIGGDGNVYEGRGWTREGAHSYSYNAKSEGIAFIGTFTTTEPPQRQIDICKELIEIGVNKGYIAKDYKIFVSDQIYGIRAVAVALNRDIKTRPNWSLLP